MAYVLITKSDVLCLPETYFDSSNLFDDKNFNLPSYKVVGMQMIPLKVPNIQFLQECINFEMKITDNGSIVVRNP